MKSNVLFKEYPWVRTLHPLVSSIVSFRVSRLDTQTLTFREVGKNRKVDCPSDSYGFFVASDGLCVGQIHPNTSQSLWQWVFSHLGFRRFQNQSNMRTIEMAASQLHRNQILSVAYIVILKQMVYGPNVVTLEIIKIPKEINLYEFLQKASRDDAN